MARVKIKLQESFLFETDIPVRVTDLNYGGHLGNDAVLSIVHEARVRFLAHYQFTELDVAGAGLIMADASIQYKAEAFYGDQITAKIAVSDVGAKSFELMYWFINKENKKEIARVTTNLVCFDYKNRQIVAFPEVLKTIWNL